MVPVSGPSAARTWIFMLFSLMNRYGIILAALATPWPQSASIPIIYLSGGDVISAARGRFGHPTCTVENSSNLTEGTLPSRTAPHSGARFSQRRRITEAAETVPPT